MNEAKQSTIRVSLNLREDLAIVAKQLSKEVGRRITQNMIANHLIAEYLKSPFAPPDLSENLKKSA